MFSKIFKHAWIAGLALVIAGVVGWVMNIITLIGSSADPITGMFVARIIGVFIPPLGAVLGYF